MKPIRGRPSLRDIRTANNKSLAMYAGISGRELPPDLLNDIAPVRPRKLRTDAEEAARAVTPSESEIQKAIIKWLLLHPRVALVVRMNSGAAVETDGNGDKRYIKFHSVYKRGVRLVDLDVMLKDGRRMAIEVKRPGWRKPRDQREIEQAAYLDLIASLGGIGIFATCVEDVAAAMVKSTVVIAPTVSHR